MTELERRDLVVSGAVQRHQMRQWLRRSEAKWVETRIHMDDSTFHIEATPEQWEQINEWVEKVER